MTDCVLDESGCLVCPYIPASPFVPDRTVVANVVGWNAGAYSDSRLDGHIRVRNVKMPAHAVAAVIGFRSDVASPQNPALVEHGLHFRSISGADFVSAIEHGVEVSSTQSRIATDAFSIERVAGVVTYYKNDVAFHTSAVASTGAKNVVSALYASGDLIQ